jgi:hypothetical protein
VACDGCRVQDDLGRIASAPDSLAVPHSEWQTFHLGLLASAVPSMQRQYVVLEELSIARHCKRMYTKNVRMDATSQKARRWRHPGLISCQAGDAKSSASNRPPGTAASEAMQARIAAARLYKKSVSPPEASAPSPVPPVTVPSSSVAGTLPDQATSSPVVAQAQSDVMIRSSFSTPYPSFQPAPTPQSPSSQGVRDQGIISSSSSSQPTSQPSSQSGGVRDVADSVTSQSAPSGGEASSTGGEGVTASWLSGVISDYDAAQGAKARGAMRAEDFTSMREAEQRSQVHQGASGLVLKDSTFQGKPVLQRSTCEVPKCK